MHWLIFFLIHGHTNRTFQVQLQIISTYSVIYPGCKFLHGSVIIAQIQNWINTSIDFQGLLPFRKQAFPLEGTVQVLWHTSMSHTPLYRWTQAQYIALGLCICWINSKELESLGWAPLEWGSCCLCSSLPVLGGTTHQLWHCGLRTLPSDTSGSIHPSFLLQLPQNVSSPLPHPASLHSGGPPQSSHTFGSNSSMGSSSRGFSLGTRTHVRELFT